MIYKEEKPLLSPHITQPYVWRAPQPQEQGVKKYQDKSHMLYNWELLEKVKRFIFLNHL